MYTKSSKKVFKVLPALVDAFEKGSGRLSAVELDRQFDVNCRTLNVNLQKLVVAGILSSQTGGKNPGYGFANDPRTISLYDVMRVITNIDYPLWLADDHIAETEECPMRKIFNSAVDRISQDLQEVSCYDLYRSRLLQA